MGSVVIISPKTANIFALFIFDIDPGSLDISEKYGVWVEKNMYGKKYFGIERTTFIINKNKIIQHVWNKVKVNNHVEEVLDYINNSIN